MRVTESGFGGFVENPLRYYHVRLFYYVSEDPPKIFHVDVANLIEPILLKQIVEPFQKGKQFSFSNRIFQPNEVAYIQISGTPYRISEILGLPHDFPFGGTDVTNEFIEKTRKSSNTAKIDHLTRNVFIAHGREHGPLKELKTLLTDWAFNPIVLHEQASGGSTTLAEKLEKYAEKISYAFVILTPDDVGAHKDDLQKKYGKNSPWYNRPVAIAGLKLFEDIVAGLEPRARQNVIFEMGYFWGILERKKVCCLLQGNVEKPSDIDGIVYIPFKQSISEVENAIKKELEAAGYKIG